MTTVLVVSASFLSTRMLPILILDSRAPALTDMANESNGRSQISAFVSLLLFTYVS